MIAVVAIVVIGPKELPRTLRTIGQWVAKARSLTREFQSNFSDMITKSLQHQFRSNDGIYFLALCMFYLIAKGAEISVIKPYWGRRLLYNIPYFCRNRDFIYIKLGKDSKLNEKYENILSP